MANPTDDPPIPQPGRDSLPDAQARLADYRALPLQQRNYRSVMSADLWPTLWARSRPGSGRQ